MLKYIKYWWRWIRSRCYKCNTKFVDHYFCYTCGDWVYWWPNRGNSSTCNSCDTELTLDGYCEICNDYPHRKCIREEEDFLLSEVEDDRRDGKLITPFVPSKPIALSLAKHYGHAFSRAEAGARFIATVAAISATIKLEYKAPWPPISLIEAPGNFPEPIKSMLDELGWPNEKKSLKLLASEFKEFITQQKSITYPHSIIRLSDDGSILLVAKDPPLDNWFWAKKDKI